MEKKPTPKKPKRAAKKKAGGDYPPTSCSRSCEMVEDESKWAAHYKRDRDQWIERYREAVDAFKGTLHCHQNCPCTNRSIAAKLEAILPENSSKS